MPRKLARLLANLCSLFGKDKKARRRIRYLVMSKLLGDAAAKELPPGPHSESLIYEKAQDILFPRKAEQAEKLLVIVVPEHNEMSGGIYSMFSIANQMRRLRAQHGYEVLMVTRPNIEHLTYLRQTNFRNSENVFRFSQLLRCKKVKELYLHLPEYASEHFIHTLTRDERRYLQRREHLHINLLNQNILLMPERDDFKELFDLAHRVTQSVAHHAYYTQEMADRYGLETLLLPAYTDLSDYPQAPFDAKEDLIIYSPDEAPHREATLERLARDLPDYELREIRSISFDDFMDLATRCRFSISFGEGWDGYMSQPIRQGGIGMTVYNDDFFPAPHFIDYDNIFSSGDDMIENICPTIRRLAGDRAAFEALNTAYTAEHSKLYSFDGYVENVLKLARKEFGLAPS